TPHGGFYTQEELKGLVEYARQRGIMIVPEVDLPGHMQAAIAAYPQLGNFPDAPIEVRETWGISDHVLGVSDEVFDFLRDVLTQVSEIFPAPYFHIGGDECPQAEWKRSPQARTRMVEWGLTRVSEIQGKFTQFAFEVLTGHGKRVIGWDEVLESHLPDDMMVMNWRHGNGVKTATSRGFQTIIANNEHTYFDHYQGDPEHEQLAIGGLTTVKDVYTADFTPKQLEEDEQALVMGLQGQLWTEYMPTAAHVPYMAFPRMCALAERDWGSPEQSWEELEARLRAHPPRLDAPGIRYRPVACAGPAPQNAPVRPLGRRRASPDPARPAHPAGAHRPAVGVLRARARADRCGGLCPRGAARAGRRARGDRGQDFRRRVLGADLP